MRLGECQAGWLVATIGARLPIHRAVRAAAGAVSQLLLCQEWLVLEGGVDGAGELSVAVMSRMPDVGPEHPFHRFSSAVERGKAALLGPTVGWTQTEARIRRVFGDQPFALGEAYVDAAVRLRVLDPGADFEAMIEKASDYLIELEERRTPEVIARWPEVHKELTAAIQEVRRRR